MFQEKYPTKAKAEKRAQQLFKTNPYVVVIESRGEFHVETESAMIRTWEEVVLRLEKH